MHIFLQVDILQVHINVYHVQKQNQDNFSLHISVL